MAIGSGDVVRMRQAIASAADSVALVNSRHFTQLPLSHAFMTLANSIEVFEVLLDAGADPHADAGPTIESLNHLGDDDRIAYLKARLEANSKFELPPYPMGLKALGSRNPEIVGLFMKHGVDMREITEPFGGIIPHLFQQFSDPLPVLKFLVSEGIIAKETDEQALVGANARMFMRHPIAWAYLRQVGFDFDWLEWTTLQFAAATGTLDDVQRALSSCPDIDGCDRLGNTALVLAAVRGETAMVMLLLDRGASVEKLEATGTSVLNCAVLSGDKEMVDKLLRAGAPIDDANEFGQSPLITAAQMGDMAMFRLLLKWGADFTEIISEDGNEKFPIRDSFVEAVLDYNRSRSPKPGDYLKFILEDQAPLLALRKTEFAVGRHIREGNANPEQITDPFKLAMIRAGETSWGARERFKAPFNKGKQPPIWCFNRFGQTITELPDGRFIFVAGEHEDGYDPDFAIYNDVTVLHTDGTIQIYGYPYTQFEPTDFHTATLVGNELWIVGGLGYAVQRQGYMPVYRLNLETFAIEKLNTSGDSPPRFYNHGARLEGKFLRIAGGKVSTLDATKKRWANVENGEIYLLNVETLQWTKHN